MAGTVKKPDEPPTVVVQAPETLPGNLKSIGGSMSDDWNNILANQTVNESTRPLKGARSS